MRSVNLSRSFNADKLKELILYVAKRSMSDPAFGAIKLNKILYFSDFWHYAIKGEAITWAQYQRLKQGPAPKPLLPIQRELCDEGSADLVPAKYFGFTQKRLVPRRDPDLSVFTTEEISFVDQVIDLLKDCNATEASDISHKLSLAWNLVSDLTEIPYESVFLSVDPPSDLDLARGVEIAKEYGYTEA